VVLLRCSQDTGDKTVNSESLLATQLAEFLNSNNVKPDVNGDTVTLLQDGQELDPVVLFVYGVKPEEVTLAEHPEGADRGGYVPHAGFLCYYDENYGEWGI
jgi:hypothetical protein